MRKQTAGFTLLETLLVVIIIGIVSAIAIPSWLSFNQRQRVGTARDRVVQIIREAQDKARQTKTRYEVKFDTTVDPPQLAVVPFGTTNPPTWQTLGVDNIKPGMLQLQVVSANNPPLLFYYEGNLKPSSQPLADSSFFKAIISVPGQPGTKQCVIVQTLLGAIREVSKKEDQNQCS